MQHQHINKLLFYRKRMGFTQGYIARLLGHSDTSMIGHYEAGRFMPTLKGALTLEIILRTPVAFLFPSLYDEIRTRVRRQEEDIKSGQQVLRINSGIK
jgi:transcriptional regulator with XRE-family HTH domain